MRREKGSRIDAMPVEVPRTALVISWSMAAAEEDQGRV
jgi:hypothetical protein